MAISRILHEMIGVEKRLNKLEWQSCNFPKYKQNNATKFNFIDTIVQGRTLLVGEGNLSFSASLIRTGRIIPGWLTATTFENAQNLPLGGEENINSLRAYGINVLHGVDATNLVATFGAFRFDNIIFQFPHTGSRTPVEGHNPNFILIRDFLISASFQLDRNGKVFVSVVNSPHYEGTFQFEKAAKLSGFFPPDIYPFDPSAFPGYEHTMTHQDGSALDNHNKFSTWVFSRGY